MRSLDNWPLFILVGLECPRGYFNNAAQSERDCVRCYCFGMTTDCTSSGMYMAQVRQLPLLKFTCIIISIVTTHCLPETCTFISCFLLQTTIRDGIVLADEEGSQLSSNLYTYDSRSGEYNIPDYRRAPSGNLYWKITDQVRGKQVSLCLCYVLSLFGTTD